MYFLKYLVMWTVPTFESCEISETMWSIDDTYILHLVSEDSQFPVDLSFTKLCFSWTTMLFLFLAPEHCNLGCLSLFAHRPLRSLEKFMAHLWQIHKTSKLILTLSFLATLIFPLPQFLIFIFCINFQNC